MTHGLTHTDIKDLVAAGPGRAPVINLLSSATTSFIALMDYMQAMMTLAHDAAEGKVAANQVTSKVVTSSARFASDVQNSVADATEFQANQQYAAMAESLTGGLVAGGSLFAQDSTTKFSKKMDAMLGKAGTYKNMSGATVSDRSTLFTASEGSSSLSDADKVVLSDYRDQLRRGAIHPEIYQRLARGKGLDEPLKDGSEVTLGRVLSGAQTDPEFDTLVEGISKERDNANDAVKAKLQKIASWSDLGNSITKSGVSAYNSQATLGQAQAQRDQGAASQAQTLSQAGVQFLQDAMKTQDQMFAQAWQEAGTVLSQFVATAVSMDTKG